MKALLLTALLAVPAVALANDPSADNGQFSETKVVDKIHHVNKMNTELGNLAQTRGGTAQIRKFGAGLVKDHQKLDDQVITYAKAHNITLGESMVDQQVGVTNEKEGNVDRGVLGNTGGNAPGSTTEGGVANAPTPSSPSSKDYGVTPPTSDKYQSTAPSSSSMAANDKDSKRKDHEAKLDRLRSLQGTEFDSQFLSDVIDGTQMGITRLQGWRGQGDKKLDGLIDDALKVLKNDQAGAQKLQQKTPATS